MDPTIMAMLYGSTGVMPNMPGLDDPMAATMGMPQAPPQEAYRSVVPGAPTVPPVQGLDLPPAPPVTPALPALPGIPGLPTTNMTPASMAPPLPQSGPDVVGMSGVGGGSLGEALAGPPAGGVPMPRPRPAEAPGATPAATPKPGEDQLLKTLRGIVPPKAPEAQKVSTPHLPPMRPIPGGGFADLMASLGVGPQQAMKGLQLPSTLGQALGGK